MPRTTPAPELEPVCVADPRGQRLGMNLLISGRATVDKAFHVSESESA